MKRFATMILAMTLIASLFTGCDNRTIAEEPSSGNGTGTAATQTNANPASFDEVYGPQLKAYMNRQYYFDGNPVMKQESNFYFIASFRDLSSYASNGYYPATSLGFIDLSANYSGEEFNTYGEFFVMYSEKSFESTCILCQRAEKEGVTLDDETRQSVDDMMEDIRTNKLPSTGKTMDDYLQTYYGPGMDEATFRTIIERYYLADVYSKKYCADYQFTEEETSVPYLRYALFYADQNADQATKDAALESAQQMKDACKTIDDMTPLAEAARESGLVRDQGDIEVPKGRMVPKFEEWAYGEGRTEGELDIIYAPEYGYFLVGYLGRKALSDEDLQQVALTTLSNELLEEINSNVHDFHADEAAAAAEPMQTNNVIVIVFVSLAGVAILAAIIVLINHVMKSGKEENSGKSGSKSSGKSQSKSGNNKKKNKR